MFSTKRCFEKRNKTDRSPCSVKGGDGPIFFNLCPVLGLITCVIHPSKLYFEVGGYIVYSTNHLGDFGRREFHFPARILPGSRRDSRREEKSRPPKSRRDPGGIPAEISAGSRQDPGPYFTRDITIIIAKYHDLSVSRRSIIDQLATDKL